MFRSKMPMPRVRRTALVEVGTSSCSGIIVDSVRGYVLTHASVLLPLLTRKPLLMHCLQKTGRLDHLDISDNFPSVKVVFVLAVTTYCY